MPCNLANCLFVAFNSALALGSFGPSNPSVLIISILFAESLDDLGPKNIVLTNPQINDAPKSFEAQVIELVCEINGNGVVVSRITDITV